MIEILGYIFLYLIVGVVLLPLTMAGNVESKVKQKSRLLWWFILWPTVIPLAIFIILIVGWRELKNYK